MSRLSKEEKKRILMEEKAAYEALKKIEEEKRYHEKMQKKLELEEKLKFANIIKTGVKGTTKGIKWLGREVAKK